MSFKMKYEITPKYLTKPSKRRSGKAMQKVRFIVAHDTGNPNSTALGNISYYENSRNEISASAHIFLDDKGIYECIPALTAPPEKAWHVLYNVTTDNQLYGCDANDAAIGVEYCYGTNINADESYKRYIWTLAYICYKFNLDPSKSIVGHFILDPERKTDPRSGLKASGRTYEQLLKDVVIEYNECTGKAEVQTQSAAPTTTTSDNVDNVKIVVNDKLVGTGRLLEDSHVYLPLRKLGEALGKNVAWDDAKKLPLVEGKPVSQFRLIDNTTYIQVRAASELLGAKVSFDGGVKKVYIYN